MEFKYIHIQDFKAIKDMRIDYDAGLWEVIGVNEDGPYLSNGSSKTTALEAVQQCLFNRTTLPVPIEDTSRKELGSSSSAKTFKLTTEFVKDGSTYVVINDRSRMKITVMKDGEDMGIKSIPQALKRIQTIIGMDINTFITLTFITHTTIGELLENFSSSALMKIILDFNQITELDKAMKLEVRVVNETVNSHTNKIKSIEDSLEVLSKYTEIDLTPFHRKKANITAQIAYASRTIDESQKIINTYDAATLVIVTASAKLKVAKEGLCKTCGQSIDSNEDTIMALENRIKIEKANTDKIDVMKAHNKFDEAVDKRVVLQQDLVDLSGKIIAAETKNQIYAENKEKSDDLREMLVTTKTLREETVLESDILTTAVSLIKSGGLHKHLMASFVSVLNRYLAQFRSFVNLPYVAISAEANKANVGFVLHDTRFNQSIHLHSLSGGERTRLRLILLLSMLYTIKDMTSASTNILVFDESLDTLDASAAPDLAQLFNYLIAHDSKFIGLVSHGQQLDDIEFNGKLVVTKSNGIATLEVIKYE